MDVLTWLLFARWGTAGLFYCRREKAKKVTSYRQPKKKKLCNTKPNLHFFSHLSEGAKIKMEKEDDAMVKFFLKARTDSVQH